MPDEAVLQQIEIVELIQSVDLGDGFNFMRGIGNYWVSPPDRLAVFTAYGWEKSEIGPGEPRSDARIEALANQSRRAGNATPLISDPAWRYLCRSTPPRSEPSASPWAAR